ncbi:MAG: ArnT family glycosyltransferase [Candidatus Binatia bacterium]
MLKRAVIVHNDRLTRALLGVLLLAVVAAFGDLREPGLSTGDEALTALRARGLVELGGWWTPYWNGDVDLHKPPLYLWLVGVAYQVFGVNELSLRLPSVAAFLVLLAVVYRFARRLFDPAVGLLAAALTAAHPLLFSQSRVGMLDTTVILFSILAAAALTEKTSRSLYIFGLCSGLALLTKAAAAAPILLATVIYVAAFERHLLSRRAFYASLASAIVLPGIWFGSQLVLHPEELLGPHYEDFVDYRLNHDIWTSWFVYFKSLRYLWASFGGLAPLFFAAPLLVWTRPATKATARLPREVLLLYLYGLITLILVTAVRQQMTWYCLPVVVPMAILAGKLLVDLFRGELPRAVVVAASVLLSAGTFVPGAYLPQTGLIWGVRAAALFAIALVLAGKRLEPHAAAAFGLGLALAVAGGLSLRNPQVNLHNPRDSSLYRHLAAVLCDQEQFPGRLIVDFRHFPQNALMFYSGRDTAQLHRVSRDAFRQPRCAVLQGEGYQEHLAGRDVTVLRRVGDYSVLAIASP